MQIPDLSQFPELGWALALSLSWLFGEAMARWLSLPRISSYALCGFIAANFSGGVLNIAHHDALLLLSNIAFGLILFELGYRINLLWLRRNPWLTLTGFAEALLCFIAVFFCARWFGCEDLIALLLAALAMSSSPAGVLRIINEKKAAGQVTERVLHLAALNCVLAVFLFKLIVAFWVMQQQGQILPALSHSLLILLASVALGLLFGMVLPSLCQRLLNPAHDITLAFTFAIILLVVLTHALRLSPILASLSFGLMARHRRLTLNQAQRNFGALGDLFAVLLFFYAAATLDWHRIQQGLLLGALLIVVRIACKLSVCTGLAYLSGISVRKGFLTGLALTPISVFVILMLEQTRYIGISLLDELAPLAAMTLLLDVAGPILTQRALIWARETPPNPQ